MTIRDGERRAHRIDIARPHDGRWRVRGSIAGGEQIEIWRERVGRVDDGIVAERSPQVRECRAQRGRHHTRRAQYPPLLPLLDVVPDAPPVPSV